MGLAEACDYMFIMGYNFYGPWSQTSGACAPLTGGSYNISNTVNYQFGEVVETYPEKLILGVPYYGNRWETEDGEAYSTAIDHTNQPTYSIAKNTADTYGPLWDDISQTPYCSYIESDSWYQVWYDSDTSLGLKYDLAEANNYKGIGMWALGYDADKPELWDEIRRRYEGTSSIGELEDNKLTVNVSYVSSDVLAVRFHSQEKASVVCILSTISGQIIYQNNYKSASRGLQQIEIPVKQLAGGIYIVKVILEDDHVYKMGSKKVFITK